MRLKYVFLYLDDAKLGIGSRLSVLITKSEYKWSFQDRWEVIRILFAEPLKKEKSL